MYWANYGRSNPSLCVFSVYKIMDGLGNKMQGLFLRPAYTRLNPL